MLKIRLKQSVIERKARIGPAAARRQERLLQAAHRRQQKHHNSLTSKSDNSARIKYQNYNRAVHKSQSGTERDAVRFSLAHIWDVLER